MSPYLAEAGALVVYMGMTFMLAKLLSLSPVDSYIFYGVMTLLGLIAMALWLYFRTKWKNRGGGGAAAGGGEMDDASIDQIVREADARLARENVTIANLPLVFVVGDRASTKTSTMMYSGIEPELIAGAAYGEGNSIMPTQHANVWYARGTAFIEAAGAVFATPDKWLALVRRLKPASLKSLVGKGQQAPRGVLLCFDVESFAKPGAADTVTAGARYIQARFAEISQVLGINFPVYVLFTRTDRLQFFTEYVRNLSNEEATQVFGVTLPIRDYTQGIYAKDEADRLNEAFNNLFHSLCDKRTILLPREGDNTKTPLPYEFPREFAKLRGSIVNFLVEVCRPSQLRASPFLRGFYFAGVRPIVIADAAPMSMRAENPEDSLRSAGAATQMFSASKLKEDQMKAAQAKAQSAGRRVPQWMFLGHLFNGVLLQDTSALGASGSSTRTSGLQRVLLGVAAGLLLLYSLGLLVSFLKNRSLENQAIDAAQALTSTELTNCAVPTLDQLQKLDTLRKSLVDLADYRKNGSPFFHGLGLYSGNDMLPEVRKAYYDRFGALLFKRTQKGLIKFMGSRPENPDPERDNFIEAYDNVKAYLLTAAEYERANKDPSLVDFLGTTLNQRWAACKEPPTKEIADLAEKQFRFYANDRDTGVNPYPGVNDKSVETGRLYLSKFGGVRTAYAALLGDANKKKPAITYNQRFPGTDYAVVDRVPVSFAFTKEGFGYMLKLIDGNKFGGEAWVLGNYANAAKPAGDLAQGIREAYNKDYVDVWRRVVKEARFQSYSGLPDAKDKLTQIISSPQPIICVFWWTSQNTNIEFGSVKQAFASVHAVAPPTDAESCVTAKNESYNTALRDLQQAISKAVQPGANPIDTASSLNVQKDSAKATVSSLAQGAVDPEFRLNESVKNLLLAPIIGVQGPDITKGPNDAGGAFCKGFDSVIKTKFPFAARARDEVSLTELADVFKPKTGSLYSFYLATANKYITCNSSGCQALPDAALPPNPSFVSAMSSLMRFSTALYGDGTRSEPSFGYTLRPTSEAYDRFNITVNGTKELVNTGQTKSYTWPGSPSPSFSVELLFPGNSSGDSVINPSSLWSVFRFLATADKIEGTTYTFNRRGNNNNAIGTAPNGKPTVYQFAVEGPQVLFGNGQLNGLNCVGKVLK